MKTKHPILVLAVLALTGALGAQGYPYVITDLGTVPGNTAPLAWGINESGDTAVGWFSWPVLGWVRAPSGMSLVGTLPGCASSSARDVNDSGQIVGSSWVATINQPGHAYRLTPGTGMVDLGTLGGTSSEAWRINNSGQVIGDAAAGDGNYHAFLYTDGVGMVNLAPQSSTSYGRGISHDGKATGTMLVGSSWRAFRSIPGVGLSNIGVPAGYAHSYGYAINDLGQVAGTLSLGTNTHSVLFRWTPGVGFQIFGSSASLTAAWAMNASGTVVGRSPVGGVYRPVMYADGLGMVDLNTLINPASGWNLLYANDINDAGQIVGFGHFGPMGETHAFRLDPTLPPSMIFAGPGCASGSPPVLFSTLPHLAQGLTLTLTQAQPGLAGALVVSNPPPFSLPLGGGCVAYVDVGAFATLAPVATDPAGSWSMALTIPNDPLLLGAQFALQAVLHPASGPLGFDLSNGLLATIGY